MSKADSGIERQQLAETVSERARNLYLTGQAAETAALVILDRRPALASKAEVDYLHTRDSWLGVKLRRLVELVRGSKKSGYDRLSQAAKGFAQ